MYIIASEIITRYSGISCSKFITEHIFHPLGMGSSTYSSVEAQNNPNMSDAFSLVAGGRRIPNTWNLMCDELEAGPGGVNSSAADMLGAKFHNILIYLFSD